MHQHSASTLARGAADLGGGLLATLLAPLGPLRNAKPLHPRGEVRKARLEVTSPVPALGVPAFAEQGSIDCRVRLSRAVGLPPPLPDVLGLALRLHPEAATGRREDLLLASTGTGPLGRFLLAPRIRFADAPLTTLLPVRSASGPVLFAARPWSDTMYELAWARPSGPWTALGRLTLGPPISADPDPDDVRFDPVTNPIVGLSNYPVVSRLREPAYAWARRLWPR